ncbi:unnamed protein product, partial [Ixodes hexagonus]
IDPDSLRNVSELISSKGYPVEEHEAVTGDGYLLSIQRISRGMNESPDTTSPHKTPVLLQHGLFGDSSQFVLNFPNQSLGFILADAGYDVWLGNSRGSTYSSHVNLTRNDKTFWEFSADEIASEDIPSIVDTILKITGRSKLQYVGYSQGVLTMMALLSEKPEYNEKLHCCWLKWMLTRKFLLVDVVRKDRNCRTSVKQKFDILLFYLQCHIDVKGQFLSSTPAFKIAAMALCGSSADDSICAAIIVFGQGVDSKQLNKTRLSVYFTHFPAGSSVNNILQLVQLVRCNCFQKFDHGILKNVAKYGKVKPPPYVLSRVTLPVALYWSKGDWFATEKDVARLRNELKNVVEYYQVPEEQFTHLDFAWGINAEPILYRKMMRVMKEFQN